MCVGCVLRYSSLRKVNLIMSSLGINPDFSLQEILDVVAKDGWTVQFSPALRGPGGQQGGSIIKRTRVIPSKREDETLSEYHSRLQQSGHGDVVDAQQKAAQVREAVGGLEGKTGVSLVKSEGGQLQPMPHGAALLKEQANPGAEIVESYNSFNEAIDGAVNRGMRAPSLPSVF